VARTQIGASLRLGSDNHRIPIQPKSLQKLPQPVRVVDGAAFCAAGAKQCSAGIRNRAAAAADFDDGLKL
jgi:hypothetical protein